MSNASAFVTPSSLSFSSSSSASSASSSSSQTSISTAQKKNTLVATSARKRRPRYDDDDDDDDYDGDDNFDYDYEDNDGYYNYEQDYGTEYKQRRRRRRQTRNNNPQRTNLDNSPDLSSSSSFLSSFSGMKLPASVSQSLLAGTFVLGIGTGVTVDSQINTNPKDLASRDAVDQAAPNPTLCTTYGASAMAFDQRVFVSFNPFNVYVAQADVKPACVLRQANVVPVLQDRGLINKKEVKQCKDNMSNTWAFVGDLNDYPQLSCVYKSEDAQNEFLSNPKYGIGEDIYDDDREMLEAAIKNNKGGGKMNIKTGLTEGEKAIKEKAAALKSKNDVLLLEKENLSM